MSNGKSLRGAIGVVVIAALAFCALELYRIETRTAMMASRLPERAACQELFAALRVVHQDDEVITQRLIDGQERICGKPVTNVAAETPTTAENR